MPCTVERLGVGREPTPAILAFLSEPPEVVSFWISFFPVLLFKVFSRFLFFGKVGTICHDIVNLQTFLLLYLVRYASILSKIYPLVITMVTHANGLQTRALVDQVYTGIKKMFSLLHKYIFDGSRNRKLGFLKTDFSVSVFILTQSVTTDRRMTSELKWDSSLGAGNLLILCHNDTLPHSHTISGSVADLTDITIKREMG